MIHGMIRYHVLPYYQEDLCNIPIPMIAHWAR